MADSPRYHVALGDAVPDPSPGMRLIPLARPEATIAAVRYVQLPQWKEWGIRASRVTLSLGQADLLATLGDTELAAMAYPHWLEHAAAITAMLPSLCEPDSDITLIPCQHFQGWEWEVRFNAVVSGIIGA